MANLKIHNLHSTDSEMHQLTKTSNFKIHNLSTTDSEMYELADDESGKVIGGCPQCKDWKKIYSLDGFQPCPKTEDW